MEEETPSEERVDTTTPGPSVLARRKRSLEGNEGIPLKAPRGDETLDVTERFYTEVSHIFVFGHQFLPRVRLLSRMGKP